MLELADERDRVAAFLAAEAKPDTFLGADRERRRLLGVERAEAGDAATDALERDVLAGQRDEIRGLPDPLHVLGEDSHLAAGYGAQRAVAGAIHTPRGRCSERQPRSSTPSPSAYRSVMPLT